MTPVAGPPVVFDDLLAIGPPAAFDDLPVPEAPIPRASDAERAPEKKKKKKKKKESTTPALEYSRREPEAEQRQEAAKKKEESGPMWTTVAGRRREVRGLSPAPLSRLGARARTREPDGAAVGGTLLPL